MVEFINYKDEKLPISVDFYALGQLEKEGLDLEKDGMKAMERLFWFSLIAGHFHEDVELKIKEANSPIIFGFVFDQFEKCMTLFLASRMEKPKKKPEKKQV